MSSRRDDRSHSRRDSPPSRRDSYSRRSSPDSSRSSSMRSSSPARTEKDLPLQFGRDPDKEVVDDDSNVIQRMKRGFDASPLSALYKCIDSTSYKLKVWTRNYNQVRAICTGRVVAFDKHWNLVMVDVKEAYIKPKKGKTPYLDDVADGDSYIELPPKTPKVKKSGKVPETETEEVEIIPSAEAEEGGKKEKKSKKKKKRNKNPFSTHQRELKQCFIRGDNIVMAYVYQESENDSDTE